MRCIKLKSKINRIEDISTTMNTQNSQNSQNTENTKSNPSNPNNPNNPIEIISERILYDLWYSVAESIFKKVCEVTELNEEQIEALKQVALRPNDFQIEFI